MISLVLGAGLTVISASNASPASPSWTCAYVAERLPRVLVARGHDAVSAGEARVARTRLSLPESILTRASALALTRSLGGSRLVMVRCRDEGDQAAIEAQAFEIDRPAAGDLARVTRPRTEIASAIDEIAGRLASPGSRADGPPLRPPAPLALAKAGPALLSPTAIERAHGLVRALEFDPACLDLRLSAVEALIAARDFDAAIRLASVADGPDTPKTLARTLRFQAAAALLETGRYAEASDAMTALLRSQETAAALNNLGIARFRLRDPEASAVFGRAGTLPDTRQNDIAFNRSLALIFEGRAALALPALDRSMDAVPGDAHLRLLKVWALRMLNRETERGLEWERLMDMAPSFASLGAPDLARRLERIFLSERIPER